MWVYTHSYHDLSCQCYCFPRVHPKLLCGSVQCIERSSSCQVLRYVSFEIRDTEAPVSNYSCMSCSSTSKLTINGFILVSSFVLSTKKVSCPLSVLPMCLPPLLILPCGELDVSHFVLLRALIVCFYTLWQCARVRGSCNIHSSGNSSSQLSDWTPYI